MMEFTKVNKVVNNERNVLLPLPSSAPPIISPFPKALPEGRTVELARSTIKISDAPSGVLLLATVNWSAVFPSNTFTTGGWVEVTFELMRSGAVIYRIHQSAVQGENRGSEVLPTLTVFRSSGLRHFDTAPVCDKTGRVTYTLRATNIVIVDPIGETDVVATANVGAVTLTLVESCLSQ